MVSTSLLYTEVFYSSYKNFWSTYTPKHDKRLALMQYAVTNPSIYAVTGEGIMTTWQQL